MARKITVIIMEITKIKNKLGKVKSKCEKN